MEYKNSRTAKRRRYKSRYHSPHNYKTQRSKSENRTAILVAVATFLVIASLVLIFTFGDQIYAFMDGIFHPAVSTADEATVPPETTAPTEGATVPPTEAPTEPPTQAPTEEPTLPQVQQDAAFLSLLNSAGLSVDSLSGSQMILVQSTGTNATVYTYEKNSEGLWVQKFSPIAGYVGAGGVKAQVAPEDNATPSGTYNIEYAMGINADPGSLLKYYQIVYGMVWITDPANADYNRWIRTEDTTKKGQWLHEYTISYPYAVIFDYNRVNVDSTQGCMKFLHVGSAPTKKGGVAIPEASLKSILLWLDPAAAPTISIF